MLKTANPTRPRTLDELLDPKLAAGVARLDLASRKVFSGRMNGERRSKKRGESVEFADHKPYALGDDPRFIDWSIYARLDRLFLKLFMEEEDLSLHVAIDCSASMACGEPEKFLLAQKLAAALAYIGLVNLNRVSLTALATRQDDPPDTGAGVLSTITNLRGRRRVADMGAWLTGIEPGGATRFRDAARRIALSRQGKGVMVVLSDFFFKEGYEDGLRMLAGRGYDLFCVQIMSPQEVEPAIGGDLRLRDVEDGDAAEVTISAALLKRYKQNLAAYCDALRAFCARRDITLLSVRSDAPVESIVLDAMRRRGLLR